MTDSKKILAIADAHHGMVTTAMVVDAGLSRGSLKYLADTGSLEKYPVGYTRSPRCGKMNS